MFAIVILAWFVGIGLVALFVAAAAVLIVGPRRLDAVWLPAIAVLVTSIAVVALARPDGSAYPWLVGIAFGIALLIAWLQRGSLREVGTSRAGAVVTIGRILAGLSVGVLAGFVVSAITQSAFGLLIFPLIGLLLGLRWAMAIEQILDARRGLNQTQVTDRGPGILDE